MKRPSLGREYLAIPVVVAAGAVLGGSAIAYTAGEALAAISFAFGLLFFAYAARYYVATISVLLAPSIEIVNGKNGANASNGNGANGTPMVSVHLAIYNEEHVIDRLLAACTKFDYPNYEVVVVDDSKDGTVGRLKEWLLNAMKYDGQKLKIIHRSDRSGFKGGALNEALKHTSPKAEYIVVLDADFVPEPDMLKKFLAYFNKHGANGNGNGGGRYGNGRLAAVQGYQWHTLNRSENWLTRGVSCEFSGSYMVDRTFQEVAGVLKMVAGSVYMIRADLLKQYGWSASITEDWELTLRLYQDGYKVLYTPLVQAPAECPSTLGKLIRQRMRWAEGHTYNVKRHFFRVLRSSELALREKLEFLYFAPYYLQSVFLILGTFFWLMSDVVLGTKLPFWTAEIGWGLVLTNLLALPLMSLAGLFLEKRARRDFGGLLSQLLLIYALSPYQAYASLKGLIEPVEGSWVRTFKSGRLAGFPGKLQPRKVIKNVLPPRKRASIPTAKVLIIAALGVSLVLAGTFVQGSIAWSQTPDPAYYFYNQNAPIGYSPFPNTQPGTSFLMHLAPPTGQDTSVPIGNSKGSGPLFFSDPAPENVNLPTGASVSIHVWANSSKSGCGWCDSSANPEWTTTSTTSTTTQSRGYLNFIIEVYDPGTNTVIPIQGAEDAEVLALQPGLDLYQVSWGHIDGGQTVLKGETLIALVWCTGCDSSPVLLFNSPAHPSSIDFPIEVPEDSISLLAVACIIPALAGLVVDRSKRPKGENSSADEGGGVRGIQRTLIIAAAIILLTMPLVLSFNDLLASLASATGFDRLVSVTVPYETSAVGDLLKGFGLPAGSNAASVWLGVGFVPVTALVDWNCAGWQGMFLFGVTAVVGLEEVRSNGGRLLVLLAGVGGVFLVNVARILVVVLLGYYVSYPDALIFHDYGGALMTLSWLVFFWSLVLRRQSRDRLKTSDF
ncbi:MAG TPA: glycosyltransferase [Nitrososphaerales archaeon]|nr:glycosyltransferase [Nitrososphaerales archaeon]